MKTQTWIIKADGIGILTVITSIDAVAKVAIDKAVARLPITATYHKLTASKIKEDFGGGE